MLDRYVLEAKQKPGARGKDGNNHGGRIQMLAHQVRQRVSRQDRIFVTRGGGERGERGHGASFCSRKNRVLTSMCKSSARVVGDWALPGEMRQVASLVVSPMSGSAANSISTLVNHSCSRSSPPMTTLPTSCLSYSPFLCWSHDVLNGNTELVPTLPRFACHSRLQLKDAMGNLSAPSST